MRRCFPLFIALVSLALPGRSVQAQSHAAQSHAAHWTYEGAEGPVAWGRLVAAWNVCSTGHEQSPIDLGGKVGPHKARIEERFIATPFVLFHNGHTIQAAIERPSDLTVEGGHFSSAQFHFHHPSEHTVNGKAYPAELHLVHKNDRGELAVLGIFIEFASQDNPVFESMISRLPKAAGDSVQLSSPVDLAALIEDHAGESEEIFSYHGSLTTPPCSEGVKWTVRSRPMHASFRQMQRLVAVLGESARPVQPVFDRK